MFDKKQYMPILKWKTGERKAVKKLTDEVKDKILPIFMVMPNTEPDSFLAQVTQIWGTERPFYLDFHHNFAGNKDINDFMSTLLEETEDDEIAFIPVISTTKDDAYFEIIKGNTKLFNLGLALRMTSKDFDELKSTIDEIIEDIDVELNKIDLIIDLGPTELPNELFKTLVTIINKLIEEVNPLGFRSIIVSGSSFPEALRGIPQNDISEIRRKEWALWQEIHKKYPKVKFGDYAVDDPHDITYDQRVTIIPTIRYTHDNYWYIVRGKYDSKAPYDFTQYHRLSKMLVNKKGLYCGKNFSWGDKKIYECAATKCAGIGEKCNHGSPLTWVQIATNHHLTYVVNQLSGLS